MESKRKGLATRAEPLSVTFRQLRRGVPAFKSVLTRLRGRNPQDLSPEIYPAPGCKLGLAKIAAGPEDSIPPGEAGYVRPPLLVNEIVRDVIVGPDHLKNHRGARQRAPYRNQKRDASS
jgi:hypothetical protein